MNDFPNTSGSSTVVLYIGSKLPPLRPLLRATNILTVHNRRVVVSNSLYGL